jgi:hypothetical protein
MEDETADTVPGGEGLQKGLGIRTAYGKGNDNQVIAGGADESGKPLTFSTKGGRTTPARFVRQDKKT